jgi:cell division protein FtsZ
VDQRTEGEVLGQKWRQVREAISDRMLLACLPVSPEKVHLEGGVLTIEVDSAFKKRYVFRKLPKLKEAVAGALGAAEIRITELPLIEEMERAQQPPPTPGANLMVIGVGAGGINALERMLEAGLTGVRLVAADTDTQLLSVSRATEKLVLGEGLTRGRGTGGDVDKGRQAAEAVVWEIEKLVAQAHLVFLTCGLGGGTGTGATPVIARLAREAEALTVGVVTLPFEFEGPVRRERAELGLEELRRQVDVVIAIENQRLFEQAANVPISQAFALADEVLRTGVQGISDLITVPGLVNLDFADVASVLRGAGTAMMGIGEGQGENRAAQAAKAAASNPLFGDSLRGARRVLLNVTGGEDLTLGEVTHIAGVIKKQLAASADVIFGAVIRPEMAGRVRVTVIAADFRSPAFAEEPGEGLSTPSTPLRPPQRVSVDEKDVDIPAFLRRKKTE